jgi:putative tryptophan/tyrosine transport system substrate-binding protein
MTQRRVLLVGATATLFSPALAGGQAPRPPIVGYLQERTPGDNLKAFVQGLREAGHVEGQTFQIVHRSYDGKVERLRALAGELVSLGPVAICGNSPHSIRALLAVGGAVPIVAVDLESDPVADGFVASLARPSGRITGLFLDMPEMAGKLLQLLGETVPRLSPLAVLWDGAIGERQFRALEAAARQARIAIHSLPMLRPEEAAPAVETAAAKGAHGLVMLTSPVLSVARARVAEQALRQRLPSISLFLRYAGEGGLMAYGPDTTAMFRQAGGFVARILRGGRPAEMPVERPSRFELVINLTVAKALGLTIPPSLLQRADRVIG